MSLRNNAKALLISGSVTAIVLALPHVACAQGRILLAQQQQEAPDKSGPPRRLEGQRPGAKDQAKPEPPAAARQPQQEPKAPAGRAEPRPEAPPAKQSAPPAAPPAARPAQQAPTAPSQPAQKDAMPPAAPKAPPTATKPADTAQPTPAPGRAPAPPASAQPTAPAAPPPAASAPKRDSQPSTTQAPPAGQAPGQRQRPGQGLDSQAPTAAPAQPPAAPAPSARPAAPTPGSPPQPTQAQPGAPAPSAPAAAAPQPAPAQPPAATATPQPQNPAVPGQAPAAAQQPLPRATQQSGAIQVQPTGAQGQPLQRVDQIRTERREVVEGGRTYIREPDRVIIREGDISIIRHNEVDRFRFAARNVQSERQGGQTITTIERPDGTRIVTVVDEDGRLIRRSRRGPDGREVVLIENQYRGPMQVRGYYVDLPPPVVRIPRERYILETERASQRDIYDVLLAPPVERIDRRYTLEEVRYSPRLRERMPRVDIDTINFESGSWAIAPDQIDRLAMIADALKQAITKNPREVFLVEGHTDAVGADEDNLSLSDRRAESVAVALSERFGVPAENLTSQGYGEQNLKVPTEGPERQNRRVTLRRITPLLTGQS